MRARELGRRAVVVGDRVAVVGDLTGDAGSLARIVRIEPRTSTLRRTADDADPEERVIVANADQLAIVASLANPPPRTGLIDRCLVAAYDADVAPLLVLTKSDLAPPGDVAALYASVGVPIVATSRDGTGLDDLRTKLTGRLSVLVGHSGVGKSTLVNLLVPGADQRIGSVSAATGRGTHTTTSVIALELGTGWIIDTPGVRSFGLAHVSTDRLIAAFPEFRAAASACPRGCTHLQEECAFDDAVAAGTADARRLESLRRLLTSRAEAD